jgi:VIT1/CCC1 family predicted Fe2+/Mn2+ transporter
MEQSSKANAVIQTALLGFFSVILYFLLYYFEEEIVVWTRQGGWYLIVPLIIAFLFTFVYGAFASHFWDLLGVKAKPLKK